jgi:hypothetical protein
MAKTTHISDVMTANPVVLRGSDRIADAAIAGRTRRRRR